MSTTGVHAGSIEDMWQVAIEIAKLRAGDLAICCVDRFEALSPDTLAEFKKRAEASNLQLIVTRVDRGELTIQTQ